MGKFQIHILEVGCGEGSNANYLSKTKTNFVTGIDLSEENINYARQRYPKPKFLQMSAEHLDFPDKSFDIIYALDILEHVDNLQKTADEISRVIKPGGRLIINIPAEKSERWLLSLRPSYFREIHHVRIFKGNQMEDLWKARGFKEFKKKKVGFLDHILLYYLFTRTPVSKTQLSIGDWRQNWKTKFLYVASLYLKPGSLKTWLRYIPIWIVTIPAGYFINSIGNRYFPKSMYYEFKKQL